MDFTFTEEQIMLRETVKRFVDQEIRPLAQKIDEEHEVPRELIDAMAKLGFLGIAFPEEYGGVGAGEIGYCILLEEMIATDRYLENQEKKNWIEAKTNPAKDDIRIIENDWVLCKMLGKERRLCGLSDRDFKEYVYDYIKNRPKMKVLRVRFMPRIVLPQTRCIGYAVLYLEVR